ncbi:DUF2971 domain-containing protein [uncultured Tateyamaria sp.]|uniref:DUF2971 domain-containing protein n=1 Tax=uncultured Tateyamaria sp. TaxID=455651 RepID=UPI0026277756|nr:DUF2971 domain-containing protein [uncultured Tateyamaria sp.]
MAELKPAPTNLYRYRGYTKTSLDDSKSFDRLKLEIENAQRSRVWHSRLSEQNDPFDTNPAFVDSSIKEVKDFFEKSFWPIAGRNATFANEDFVKALADHGVSKSKARRHLKDFGQHIKTTRATFSDYRSSSLIACFSDRPDNVLMWSYYSSSHASFAFEFARDPSTSSGREAVGDVRYVSERPMLSTLDMMHRMAAWRFPDKFQLSGEDEARIDNATLLCKSEHWRHENEWRSLKTPKFDPGYYQIPNYMLSGIVFGARSSRSLIEFLDSIVRPSVRFSQAKLDESDYRLVFNSLERLDG